MEKNTSQSKLLTLFLSTFTLSAFTFGGGYVIVTLMKERFVDRYRWIDEEEMLDLVAIAQSSPGPIAINGAIAVGYKLAGIPGILIAVLGAALPPVIILSVISSFYSIFSSNPYVAAMLRGMNAGVGAVITSVVYDMGQKVAKTGDWINILLMFVCFYCSYFLKINVIWIILVVAVFGMVRTLIGERQDSASKGGAR